MEAGTQLVPDQLLDVLLDLRTELLVVADEQLQQMTYEPGKEV